MIFCSGKNWKSIFFKSKVFYPHILVFCIFFTICAYVTQKMTKSYDFMGRLHTKKEWVKTFGLGKKLLIKSMNLQLFPEVKFLNLAQKLANLHPLEIWSFFKKSFFFTSDHYQCLTRLSKICYRAVSMKPSPFCIEIKLRKMTLQKFHFYTKIRNFPADLFHIFLKPYDF